MRIGKYWLRARRLCALASVTSSLKDAVMVHNSRDVEKAGREGPLEPFGTERPAQREIAVTTALVAQCGSAN